MEEEKGKRSTNYFRRKISSELRQPAADSIEKFISICRFLDSFPSFLQLFTSFFSIAPYRDHFFFRIIEFWIWFLRLYAFAGNFFFFFFYKKDENSVSKKNDWEKEWRRGTPSSEPVLRPNFFFIPFIRKL